MGEARHVKFVVLTDTETYKCINDRLSWKGMCPGACDLFHFWEITDNISEMLQERDTVAMED